MPRSKPGMLCDIEQPGDKRAAVYLERGLTLVSYWAYNERGKLVPHSRWVKLYPGESVAQAAKRLSITPPQPQWTPQLIAQVKQMLRAWGHNPEEIL